MSKGSIAVEQYIMFHVFFVNILDATFPEGYGQLL
jgi:hypothetical protein